MSGIDSRMFRDKYDTHNIDLNGKKSVRYTFLSFFFTFKKASQCPKVKKHAKNTTRL